MVDANGMDPAGSAARRTWRLLAAGAVVAAAAAISLGAQAEMHGPGPGDMGPMMMFMGPPEHIASHVEHLLSGLNASDAQRLQITQIAQAAAADLKSQHEAERTLQQQSLQIFTAPAVDSAAAESVRQQMLVQHDQSSRRVLQAMLDISQVLTADQRAQIGERMRAHEARMQQHLQHDQEKQ